MKDADDEFRMILSFSPLYEAGDSSGDKEARCQRE